MPEDGCCWEVVRGRERANKCIMHDCDLLARLQIFLFAPRLAQKMERGWPKKMQGRFGKIWISLVSIYKRGKRCFDASYSKRDYNCVTLSWHCNYRKCNKFHFAEDGLFRYCRSGIFIRCRSMSTNMAAHLLLQPP